MCGVLSFLLHTTLREAARRQLPERNTRVTLVCRAIDSRVTHVPGLPRPTGFTAKVIQVNGKKIFPESRITVRLKNTSSLPCCGELFSGTGSLVNVDRENSFSGFLRARQIEKVWYPDTVSQVQAPSGFLYHLTTVRDKLLERCLSGLDSPRARTIAGTMFFGISGGLDPLMRTAYINSGTLHLFSVSGMHLAAIALLVLKGLFFLPRKAKYLTAAVFLTAYALSTGANPPVMRALTVILFWIAGKIFFFHKDNFDLLAIAAAILFLFNPALIYDTGTWYSFFITAVLILSAQRVNDFFNPAFAVVKNLPETKETGRFFRDLSTVKKYTLAAVLCPAAFAAGIGISAVNGNLIVPASVFINLLLLVFVPLLFAAAGIKLIAGALFPPVLLEKLLLFLHALCAEGAILAVPLTPAMPPLGESIIFCFLLLTVPGAEKRWIRYTAAAGCAALFALWMIRPLFFAPAAAVISGDSATPPVVVICEPREGLAFVVNAPDRKLVERAAAFLLEKGIRNPEVLLFSTSRVSAASALSYLADRTPPQKIRLPDDSSGRLMKKLRENGINDPLPGGREREFLQIFNKNSRTQLEYFNPGSKLNLRIEWTDTDGGRNISVNNTVPRRIPWSNRPEVIVYEFDR